MTFRHQPGPFELAPSAQGPDVSSRRRDRLFLAGNVLVFTAAAALNTASGFNHLDEAWFLQVVARVSDGEVLYREVFFGVPPLSVYVTLPLVALFGAQIAWVKIVVLAAFAAGLVLTVVTARQLGAGRAATTLLCAAMLVFAKPYGIGLYQPLASLFTLACLAAALGWAAQLDGVRGNQRRERLLIGVAGAAAGLSFASKQNIGLYTLGALLGAIVLVGAGRRLLSFVLALGGFAACALLPLIPVLLTGAFDAFIDYGFADLGTYNELGRISYVRGMLARGDDARDLFVTDFPSSYIFYAVSPAYQALLYLVIPATFAVLALAWTRTASAERSRVVIVGLFALAAGAGIFPRADAAHVAFVAPVLLVAAWYALHVLVRELPRRWRRALALGIAVALLPGVVLRAAWPVVQILDRDAHLSAIPHMRGILNDPARENRMLANASFLAREGKDRALFLAMESAGFYYLTADLQNPTPFDFPLVTAMGPSGQERVIDEIVSGKIDAVCLGFRRGEVLTPLTPRRLARAVKRTMDPSVRTSACRMFESPHPPSAFPG